MRSSALTRTSMAHALAPDTPALIEPSTSLRDKMGRRLGGVDASALAKAEEALKELSSQFGQWLSDEIRKLDAAYVAIRQDGPTTAAMDRLYLSGHDLKGLGATYGYPLISRVAGSLCKLMDGADARAAIPLALIDAHIEAIRVTVRDDIHDPEHPLGRLVAEALEAKVTAYIALAKGSSTRP